MNAKADSVDGLHQVERICLNGRDLLRFRGPWSRPYRGRVWLADMPTPQLVKDGQQTITQAAAEILLTEFDEAEAS